MEETPSPEKNCTLVLVESRIEADALAEYLPTEFSWLDPEVAPQNRKWAVKMEAQLFWKLGAAIQGELTMAITAFRKGFSAGDSAAS